MFEINAPLANRTASWPQGWTINKSALGARKHKVVQHRISSFVYRYSETRASCPDDLTSRAPIMGR